MQKVDIRELTSYPHHYIPNQNDLEDFKNFLVSLDGWVEYHAMERLPDGTSKIILKTNWYAIYNQVCAFQAPYLSYLQLHYESPQEGNLAIYF
jgi:hypothetical protein